jgi:hypothetical protein
MFFLKRQEGAVSVYIEPRGRWTEKVWEPLPYGTTKVEPISALVWRITLHRFSVYQHRRSNRWSDAYAQSENTDLYI